MQLNAIQIILVICWGFFMNYERWGSAFGLWHPVVCGFITGILVGDIQAGLYIGGSLQLMTLGISSFGGAAVPDYSTAAIVGTYLAVTTGQSNEIGVTLGIPIAVIMVQLDVLCKTINIYFQHRAEKAIEDGKYRKIMTSQYYATIVTMCTTGIPIMLVVLFGQGLVKSVFEIMPDWLNGGLSVAGGLLPVVGIGLLLRYLPVKQNLPSLLVGFALIAYLKLPMLAVAIFGLAWAIIVYQNTLKEVEQKKNSNAIVNEGYEANGVIEGDE